MPLFPSRSSRYPLPRDHSGRTTGIRWAIGSNAPTRRDRWFAPHATALVEETVEGPVLAATVQVPSWIRYGVGIGFTLGVLALGAFAVSLVTLPHDAATVRACCLIGAICFWGVTLALYQRALEAFFRFVSTESRSGGPGSGGAEDYPGSGS